MTLAFTAVAWGTRDIGPPIARAIACFSPDVFAVGFHELMTPHAWRGSVTVRAAVRIGERRRNW